MTYIKRNVEKSIHKLLSFFPVVLIIGPRQVGKTTLAKKCVPDWEYFDLEKGRDFDYLSKDLDFFFQEHKDRVVIDEAQEYPQLFKELRVVVDSDRQKKGRFLLTCSSSPDLFKGVSDTLAGRVGIVELGTLKVNETCHKPLPEFYKIFRKPLDYEDDLALFRKLVDSQADIWERFLKGGYPEIVSSDDEDFHRAWMENYYQTYINRDIKKLFPKIDSLKYRRFIEMLTALSGTIINKAQLGRAIDSSEVTVRDYLEIVDKTFLWRKVPSYEKSKAKSVVKMPKGIFRDLGLAHYLLGIETKDRLLKHPSVGLSFESFVIEEILKGIQALGPLRFDYYYYRTRGGAEIDLVLEGSFGVLPFEIKLGTTTTLKQLASLAKFVKDNKLPYGVVVNNAKEIRLLAERIIQIPAACL